MKKLFLIVIIAFVSASNAFPNQWYSVDVSNYPYQSNYKPQTNFIHGKTSGVPFALGYRLEHHWGSPQGYNPNLISAIDLGLLLPGIRLSTEKRIRHSNFYVGIGYTYLYLPLGDIFDDFNFHAVSIPISYRKEDPWDMGRVTHYSFSLNLYSFDFAKWELVPLFQVTILSGF